MFDFMFDYIAYSTSLAKIQNYIHPSENEHIPLTDKFPLILPTVLEICSFLGGSSKLHHLERFDGYFHHTAGPTVASLWIGEVISPQHFERWILPLGATNERTIGDDMEFSVTYSTQLWRLSAGCENQVTAEF